ncbi:MAG: ATP-binding protein [Desulfobacteraceae bacterium]|nr:ATP-binding protein [Desulfobacteraceae bacterium]
MKHPIIKWFVQIWGALEKKLMPPYVWTADPLTFWRERILFILCFITTAFGVVPLIPSVILSYQEGLWSVIFLDSAAYALIVVLLINRHWSLRLRGYIACLIFYWLGAGLLFILGPQGAGYIWLFGASIMISSIVGLEAAVGILVINTLTLLSVSFYAQFGAPAWAPSLGVPLQKMLVLTINFLFFNSFATITLGFMLNGLKQALETEQQASANLRKSEERYRIVADFNYDWEYWVGPGGELEYVSPSCENITGYLVADFMADSGLLLAIVHEDDRPAMAQHLNSDLDEKRSVDAIDFRIVTAQGQTRWISHYCRPAFAEGGAFLGRRVSNRDITERKNIEDSIRIHHERFLTVLDSIDASIYVADSQSHEVLFMNKHMIQSFGQDMIGSICWQAFRQAQGPCAWCLQHQLKEAERVQSWQEQNPLTQRWYFNYGRFIRWTDGRPVKIQIATDITDLKKMEAELRQTHKMEAIGTLAGGIAHDFNNILSAIIGYTELALDDAPQGTMLEANLQEVYTAGKRARDLVRQILAFARQSDEKVKPLMVSPIAKEALKLIRSSIPSSIQIHANIATDSTILGNPTQMHQILMNLCTNAAHAMEKSGGILDVDLCDIYLGKGDPLLQPNLNAGDYMKLTVSDTGHGISPEIMNSIFEPYFTTKGPGEGTGLGLATVQGIVESYGGKITVASQLGRGSVFTIYLPISSKRAESAPAVDEALPGGSERILLVDDEPPIVKMGSQTLERLGYKVITRTSSIEALELFRSRPNDFDLVITDMTMPQMSGDQLAREVMRVRQEIPVILFTGYSKQITDELAADIGIKAFAYKPLVKKDLAMTIRRVLDQQSAD